MDRREERLLHHLGLRRGLLTLCSVLVLTAAVAAVAWPRPPAACPSSIANVATIKKSAGLQELSPAGIGGSSEPGGAPVNDLGRIQVSGCPPVTPSLGG